VPALGGCDTLFQCHGAADGTIAVRFRNRLLLEQLARSLRFNTRKIQLGDQRFPVMFRGGDFFRTRAGDQLREERVGLFALRAQFGGFQFHDELAVRQAVAFAGENLFHAPAVARGHVDLIRFNGAGDSRRT
jgi:hypothetical protein